MPMRENMEVPGEVRDIIVADVALIIAFCLALSGGVLGIIHTPATAIQIFTVDLPIIAVGVSLSFILHELMHKFVAQRYGAIAGFRTSTMGLLITLATGAVGFLLGIPGATMIYVHSFTKRENGIVSLAGPLTNFVVFGVAYAMFVMINPALGTYANTALSFILFISIYLAFFNMLPISPLDGSKVLAWNPALYGIVMLVIVAIMVLVVHIALLTVVYLLVFAFVISIFYRHIL